MRSLDDVQWKVTDDGLAPFIGTQRLDWAPQPGSQVEFLACPLFEVLYQGNRGGGKTDALLFSFFQHVGRGFGADWRGIIFRRTYPELQDLIDKSLKWFKTICPQAKYNASDHTWVFPTGEKLFLRHFDKPEDYWKYHGSGFPFIAWEELCTWPSDSGYRRMMSCCRSANPNVPKLYRATANPYGPGHNFVKRRFQLPIAAHRVVGPVIRENGQARVAIHSELRENRVLLHAQPDYIEKLRLSARNEAELKAWLHGDWNIVAGGMFDDVWSNEYNVLPNFPIHAVPRGWRLDRSLDWGSSKPFSVGWWAHSNGERFEYNGTTYGPVRGDLIRIAEWYGCEPGRPNTGLRMTGWNVGRGILEQEVEWGINGRVMQGPADDSIFDPYDGIKSIAGDMAKATSGLVQWKKAGKTPGSRVRGWDAMRKLMLHAHANPAGPRENPGLFVLERCEAFRETIPVLSRSTKNPDDIDTESEDHVADEARYEVMQRKTAIRSGSW